MSIEASTSVDPFARTCQASHLLGWVCEHVNQHPSSEDADMHFQEAFTISGALRALLTMLHSESARKPEAERQKLFAARGIAYAALNTLFDVHSCIEPDNVESVGGNRGLRLDLQQHALDGFKEVIAEVSIFAAEIEQYGKTHGFDSVPVLVLFSLYTVAGTYAWYARENAAEVHLAALEDLRRLMGTVGRSKWRVGCESFVQSSWSNLLSTLTCRSSICEDVRRARVLLPGCLFPMNACHDRRWHGYIFRYLLQPLRSPQVKSPQRQCVIETGWGLERHGSCLIVHNSTSYFCSTLMRGTHPRPKVRSKVLKNLLLLHVSTTIDPSIRHYHYLLDSARSPAQVVQACTPSLPLPTSKSKCSFVEPSKEKRKRKHLLHASLQNNIPLPSLNSAP
jgi:hypothetical protein